MNREPICARLTGTKSCDATGNPMLGIADYGSFCAAIVVFLPLLGPGMFALLMPSTGGGSGASAAAMLGMVVGEPFAAMAVAITALVTLCCLDLHAFAQPLSVTIKAHRKLAGGSVARMCLIGFGIKLGTQ